MPSSQDADQNRPRTSDSKPLVSEAQSQDAFNALDTIRDEPDLRRAFEQFSEHSMRLEEAYNTLEAQFRQVSAQLHEVYCQLDGKIGELASAKSYLESLLSKMSEGVFFVGRDQKILTCNHAMSKWLGQSELELRNTIFAEKFQDDLFGFSMKKALELGQGPQVCQTQTGEDPKVSLEITTHFIAHLNDKEDGQQSASPEGLCILARDLSDLNRSQLNSLQNQTASKWETVSADLIKRLHLVLQSIDKTTATFDDEHASKGEEIRRQSISATQLLSDFSSFLEPITAQSSAVEIRSLFDEIAQGSEGQHLMVETLDALLVLADPILLKGALEDLLSELRKIAGQDHLIHIRAKGEEHRALIEVELDGVYIEDEEMVSLFSPLDTAKPKLQLAHVDKKLAAMNGQIEVHSKNKTGISFSIFLPISAQS